MDRREFVEGCALGAGGLAATPSELSRRVKEVVANDAAPWRGMKHALERHNRNAGAITAAKFILEHLTANREIPPHSHS